VQHLSNESFDYVEAEHDGYRDAPFNIMHRRRLLHVRPDLWVVADDLQSAQSSTGEHMFDFYFHFPSNATLSVQQENDSVLRVNARADSARLQLLMCTSAALKGKMIEGQMNPIQGWVSSMYGERSRAPTLCIGLQTPAPASGMFLMLPSHSGADTVDAVATKSIRVTDGSALACEAAHGGVRDIFVSSFQDQPIRILDFTLRGKLFWIRTRNGRLAQVLGIDCKEVRHRDDVLMRDDAGMSQFEYLPKL
jgi:hypothetical protein